MSIEREKARRLSRRMYILATALAGVTGAVALYGVGLLAFAPQEISRFVIDQFAGQVTPAASLSRLTVALLAALLVIQAGLLIWALIALSRAFGMIARRGLIHVEAAGLMRLSGLAFLANSAAMILLRPLASLVLSIDMPPGHRFLTIGVGTPELMALLVSGVLVVFGHLIAAAAAVDDENSRFV